MNPSVHPLELERRGGIAGRQSGHGSHAIRVGPLYDAVAAGMWTYTPAFRVTVIGPELQARAAHADRLDAPPRNGRPADLPTLYYGARLWRNRSERMSLRPATTCFCRASSPASPGPWPRARRVSLPAQRGPFPCPAYRCIRSRAPTSRGPRGRRAFPRTRSSYPAARCRTSSESRGRGVAPPVRGGDVLRGEYADLLWRLVAPERLRARQLLGCACCPRRRPTSAARRPRPRRWDARRLSGGASLARRRDRAAAPRARRSRAPCEAEWFLPVGIAYDPLGRGRTRAFVSIGPRIAPPAEDVEAATLRHLRRSTPLTCGQWVAHERLAGGEATEARLAEAVRAAREEARPVVPSFSTRANGLSASLRPFRPR